MIENFYNLEPLLKAFWMVAIPTSIIFLIQSVLTFMGTDTSDGLTADFDGDLSDVDAPFQLFTLRNLINFLLGFSWTGISFYSAIPNKPILIFVALVVGLLFIYIFLLIIQQIKKLAENNSFRLTDAMDKTAEVYLTIPGNKKGKGKIMISVKGSFHELEAITESDAIESGASVRVVKIENGNLLVVEKI